MEGAVDNALEALATPGCASLFKTNAVAALTAAYNNQQIRATDISASNPPSVGAVTIEGTAIYLGTTGYFFTGQFNGGPVNQTTVDFQGLTQNQVQEVILIHELLHWTGTVGSDNAGQTILLGNGEIVSGSGGVMQAVIAKCIN